jgi:hypothetical protein
LAVFFLGPGRGRVLSNGTSEFTRDVEIVASAQRNPGRQSAEVEINFEDKVPLRRVVSWDVIAPLRAVPPGIVIANNDGNGQFTKSIVLESDERPFRITGIKNPFAANSSWTPSAQSLRSQHIELNFDPVRPQGQRAESIRITTDHPDQPEIVVSVIVLANTSGGTP